MKPMMFRHVDTFQTDHTWRRMRLFEATTLMKKHGFALGYIFFFTTYISIYLLILKKTTVRIRICVRKKTKRRETNWVYSPTFYIISSIYYLRVASYIPFTFLPLYEILSFSSSFINLYTLQALKTQNICLSLFSSFSQGFPIIIPLLSTTQPYL